MLALLTHSRTAWNDFFTGTPTNLNSQTFYNRQSRSDSSLYVSNCLFTSISSTSNGGALSSTSSTYFLVESTSFFSCKTSGSWGGAICYNSDGQCVLHKVCGYDCSSNPYHQFSYINVENVASYMNYVNYSSISRCVNENSNSQFTMALVDGKVCCTSINLSLNKCNRQSGVGCNPFTDSNSVTCSFTYSSYTDNIAAGYTCIYFTNGGAIFEMKSCNILRNTQGTLGTEGTVFTSGILTIQDSCILGNKATNIFYGKITISNCTVDSTSNNGYLTIQNTVTKGFILALNHISTRNCHSGYDSAGTLTPNIQTPSSSNKQIHCYTHVKCFNHPQIRDFFSFHSIFIFNFLHSSTLSYP
jgi:hypothetical protein